MYGPTLINESRTTADFCSYNRASLPFHKTDQTVAMSSEAERKSPSSSPRCLTQRQNKLGQIGSGIIVNDLNVPTFAEYATVSNFLHSPSTSMCSLPSSHQFHKPGEIHQPLTLRQVIRPEKSTRNHQLEIRIHHLTRLGTRN